jgi:hypothetical protein
VDAEKPRASYVIIQDIPFIFYQALELHPSMMIAFSNAVSYFSNLASGE